MVAIADRCGPDGFGLGEEVGRGNVAVAMIDGYPGIQSQKTLYARSRYDGVAVRCRAG